MRLDPLTGAILWKYTLEYGFPWRSGLTLDATRVFADEHVCGALSRATGRAHQARSSAVATPNYPIAPFAGGRLFNLNATDALAGYGRGDRGRRRAAARVLPPADLGQHDRAWPGSGLDRVRRWTRLDAAVRRSRRWITATRPRSRR